MRSHSKYFLWAIPVSIILLWPLPMYIGGVDELGSAGPAAALSVTAFSVGMAASLLSAPLFQRGGPLRMLCADAGILTGLMGVGLSVIAAIYFQSIALLIASAGNAAVGAYLTVVNIRARAVPPAYPAPLIVTAVLNLLLTAGIGYLMLSMRWPG